ncbi:hypothetical protein SAMN05216228_1028103 [Rhizobium tibeticum]|uniref:Uncharacterized protein n=1 Tax=Rhizobium tibeticum TaxID=501024 RepID=A0A1H8TGJ4_9HYPH|nr:hypothetical protein RTCCBAU85039_5203 [Rhizobium tibeticum]SEO89935.1 hypothetical protein SAMN05216228_1028103 [Rhizobium tibeticum]
MDCELCDAGINATKPLLFPMSTSDMGAKRAYALDRRHQARKHGLNIIYYLGGHAFFCRVEAERVSHSSVESRNILLGRKFDVQFDEDRSTNAFDHSTSRRHSDFGISGSRSQGAIKIAAYSIEVYASGHGG